MTELSLELQISYEQNTKMNNLNPALAFWQTQLWNQYLNDFNEKSKCPNHPDTNFCKSFRQIEALMCLKKNFS